MGQSRGLHLVGQLIRSRLVIIVPMAVLNSLVPAELVACQEQCSSAVSVPSVNRFSSHDLPSLCNHMREKDITPCT